MKRIAEKTVIIGYRNVHPAHKGFSDSISADSIEMDGFSSSKLRYFRNAALYLKYALRLRKYDNIICEDSMSLRSGYLAKIIFGKNLFRLIADPTYIRMNRGEKNYTLQKMSEEIDGAIAVSKMAKEIAQEYIDAPIEVVHPYVSEEKRKLIKETECQDDKDIILSVGRNKGYKGFERLVEAFKRADVDKYKLVLVGKGHEDYSQFDNIEAPGYVSTEKLAEYYNCADLYIQPSYADTFPVTVLEASLVETPLIISDNVGQREFLPNHQVFSDADSLVKALNRFVRDKDSFRSIEEDFTREKSLKSFKKSFKQLETNN